MILIPLYQTTCFFIPLVAPCKPLLALVWVQAYVLTFRLVYLLLFLLLALYPAVIEKMSYCYYFLCYCCFEHCSVLFCFCRLCLRLVARSLPNVGFFFGFRVCCRVIGFLGYGGFLGEFYFCRCGSFSLLCYTNFRSCIRYKNIRSFRNCGCLNIIIYFFPLLYKL